MRLSLMLFPNHFRVPAVEEQAPPPGWSHLLSGLGRGSLLPVGGPHSLVGDGASSLWLAAQPTRLGPRSLAPNVSVGKWNPLIPSAQMALPSVLGFNLMSSFKGLA